MGVMPRSLLALAFAVVTTLGWAQEQRTVDGRRYNVHVVERGQTLFAIARVHAVPVEDLQLANPGALDGLSIGEEILVPLDAVVKRDRKRAPTLRENGELLHTVRRKETLYGIAKNYGLDMNALLERNPEALELREGMELVIPVRQVATSDPSTIRPALPANMREHLVQPGETLYALGQRYGLDPEVIRAANGGLPEGLKADARILIPKLSVAVVDSVGTERAVNPSARYKVALLLPFSVARNDSVLAQAHGEIDVPYYEPTRIAVQFYNGALLAIDSLERLGLNADIDVVDLGDDKGTWNAEIKRETMGAYDLFIGPFHRTAVEQLSRISRGAHIVCPVPQSSKMILGMPNVSKVTPTRSDLVKHTARYVAMRHAGDNIILANVDLANEKDIQQQCLTALDQALKNATGRLRDSVLVVNPGRRDISVVSAKLDANRLNVILAPSDDVEFVTTLVNKLKPLATKFRIALVGMESWTEFGSLAASDLDLLGFRFASASFTDMSDPRTQAFIKTYRERFTSDVDDYALLGFDVTFFYLKALMYQGRAFPDHFTEIHTDPLHMGFRMTRTGPENGFRNEHAIMLLQKDLKLERLP